MFANACGGEFLLHLQIPDESLDAHFAEGFQRSILGEVYKEFFKRFLVRRDGAGGVPSLRGEVGQEICNVVLKQH